jgi:hypothetical protein
VTDDSPKLGWEQKVISKIARVAIARIIEAEQVAVQVDTTVGKVMRGEITAIALQLQHITVREQFVAEALQMQIGQVLINPKEAHRGNILLQQPAMGHFVMRLTEQQFAQVLQQDLHQIWRNTTTAQATQLWVEVLRWTGQANTLLSLQLGWQDRAETQQTTKLSLIPIVASDTSTVDIIFQSFEGSVLPAETVTMVCTLVGNLMNLQDFANRGTRLAMQSLQVDAGVLVLSAVAEIVAFPSR